MIFMKSIFNVGCMSGIDCGKERNKQAKVFGFVINPDGRHPLAACFIPVNAYVPRHVVAGQLSVFAIRCTCCLAKIFPSIIVTSMVFMVNLSHRKVSGHIQKRESMGKVELAINPDANVALGTQVSSNVTNLQTSSLANFPGKYTRLRIVMKQFFKTFLSYSMFRHWFSSVKPLLGDGMLVSSRMPIIPDMRL